MFKTRLEKWGYLKKARDSDWQAMNALHRQRQDAGKRSTVFEVHGKRRTLSDLKRHMNARKTSSSGGADVHIPDYIRCYTPEQDLDTRTSTATSSTSASSAPLRDSDTLSRQRPDRTRHRSTDASSLRSGRWEMIHHPRNSSTMSNRDDPTTESPQRLTTASTLDDLALVGAVSASLDLPPSESQDRYCDVVHQDLSNLLVRSLARDCDEFPTRSHSADSYSLLSPGTASSSQGGLCTKCRSRIKDHLPFPVEFMWSQKSFLQHSIFCDDLQYAALISDEVDMACVWMACCLGACVFVRQQAFDYVAKSLLHADTVLLRMLQLRNSTVLTTLGATMTILHSHDQGKMAASVIRSALHVAQKARGPEDSITLTLEWMMALAGRQLSSCRVTTAVLRAVHADFRTRLGDKHGHTLASAYNLGFSLLREKKSEEAEVILRQLAEMSRAELGPLHSQTTCAENTLSRALSNQGKLDEAVSILRHALDSELKTYGPFHPHYLEARRRLALLYDKQGKRELREPILWEVLRGRIKSLGREHDFTLGAKESLITYLKDMDKWEDGGEAAKTIEQLFSNAEDSSSDLEAF